MKKSAVFMDGGHLRACANAASRTYTAELIVDVAKALVPSGEELFRILYYDCEPFGGSVKLPVSSGTKTYPGNSSLLADLAKQELVAVRRGVLKFRGGERTRASLKRATSATPVADADFKPKWQQKGVDLRIGLDIATATETRKIDLIILITGDTDMIPAMKLARGRGLQLAGVDLPNRSIVPELKAHLDYFRKLTAWP